MKKAKFPIFGHERTRGFFQWPGGAVRVALRYLGDLRAPDRNRLTEPKPGAYFR